MSAKAASRWPRFVITRFTVRRSWRAAVLWALVFGAYVSAKAVGFTVAYPTAASREVIATTLGSNIGLVALLGQANHLENIASWVAWNCMMIMIMIGSIWALLLATRAFRGEEDAGRWELLRSGETTAGRATADTLAGLGLSLVLFYAIAAVIFVLVGRIHNVNFGVSAALFFALAAVAGAAEFLSIGALASQIMPTRARAATVSALVFGAAFILRAMADTTSSARWLLDVSPLGWIERLKPLQAADPVWLLPIAGLVAACSAAAIWLAGQRDLGHSVVADHDTAAPRTALLGSPLPAALRFTRAAGLGWLSATVLVGLLFGLITKSATDAFNSSAAAEKVIDRLAQSGSNTGATAFLGIIFFFLMIILMAYAASAAGAIREEEASGRLDNFLVRPVGRLSWLVGRVGIVVAVIAAGAFLASLATWAGEASQQGGVGIVPLLQAGVNVMAPALLTLGACILGFAYIPRFTGALGYLVIGWSFLLQMVSSGVNVNHWLLDTSVLHQLTLAPAAAPNWRVVVTMVVLAVVLAAMGARRFIHRDLVSE